MSTALISERVARHLQMEAKNGVDIAIASFMLRSDYSVAVIV